MSTGLIACPLSSLGTLDCFLLSGGNEKVSEAVPEHNFSIAFFTIQFD
jgi:hypothetical protein